MKSECCHQHPDNGDLATQDPEQREETDLRAVNERLLSALERIQVECRAWDTIGGIAGEFMAEIDSMARNAIEANK